MHNILEILKFKFLKFSPSVSVCSNLPKYCRHSKTFDPRNEQLAHSTPWQVDEFFMHAVICTFKQS